MDYTPGAFTASIFDGKKKSSNSVLNDLFSKKATPLIKKIEKTPKDKVQTKSQKKEEKDTVRDTLKEIANTSVRKDKKAGRKRKHEETTPTPLPTKSKKVKKESSASGQEKSPHNPDKFPFVHESLLKKSQQKGKKGKKFKKYDDDDAQDLPPTRKKRDKTSDKRTIFIGNCPLSADKKVIKSLFKDYGEIESIRFRCGPTAKLALPRRAVMIKKEFHEKASSYVSFVVFEDDKAATKALEKNGHVLENHTLRVDLASNQKQHDTRKSVFVGNLPFTVTEDDLRSHFEDCGDIINVRVVRDRQTSIGKGIAYIQFDSKDGVILALKLHDQEFQERKLRVTRCSNKIKQKKTEDDPTMMKNNPRVPKKKALIKPVDFKGKAKDFYSRSEPRPEKRRTNFAPTNKTSKKSFKDLLNAKIEKRVNNRKKKRQGSQKTDGLSSIFGDIQADMKKLKMENPKFVSKKPKDKRKEKQKAKKKLKKAAAN